MNIEITKAVWRRMKRPSAGALLTMLMMAFASRAHGSAPVPEIFMPVGIGYSTDAKGVRHPNAYCMRDTVRAPRPAIPWPSVDEAIYMADSPKWKELESSGLYQLTIDLNTGRVTKVTIIKSGSNLLNAYSVATFQQWVFRPGTWKEAILPTTLRKSWKGIIVSG
jgi:hypothetical protein